MTISSAPSRLPRKLLSTAIVALAFGAPSLAFAQNTTNPNCPPGSWFCADTQEKPAAPAGQPVAPAEAPKSGELAPLPGPQPGPQKAPPQVTYAPAPPP